MNTVQAPFLLHPKRVLIVGGGLAGMAAAVALEASGAANVTLLELRKSLGGRAGSFAEPQTGEELDNCQHVLLGCCTNLIDFYRRLGAGHLIHFDSTVHFLDARGHGYGLWGVGGLPGPLHLGLALARFGALTWRERIALSRAMLAMMRLGRTGRLALAEVPFGEWLDAHRQPASLVDKLYEPLLTGALNEQCRRASSSYAIQVFQDALLSHAAGYRLGLPACPLGQLYARLPCRDVRLGARVTGLRFAGPAVTGVELAGGEMIPADAVVVATNHHAARRWIPPERFDQDARFHHLDKLESVPILGAHLWFDRPIMADSHAALLTGPLQWLFRKDAEGRVLHGVISAARDWVDRPKPEMLDAFERQVRSLFPMARSAKLVRDVIVIEKRATFSPLPGVDRYRPPQAPPAGGIANLYLAGDYTQTGWPATMEGAVRSGYLAAEAILARAPGAAAPRAKFLVDDLPPQWPARLLGRARRRVRRADHR